MQDTVRGWVHVDIPGLWACLSQLPACPIGLPHPPLGAFPKHFPNRWAASHPNDISIGAAPRPLPSRTPIFCPARGGDRGVAAPPAPACPRGKPTDCRSTCPVLTSFVVTTTSTAPYEHVTSTAHGPCRVWRRFSRDSAQWLVTASSAGDGIQCWCRHPVSSAETRRGELILARRITFQKTLTSLPGRTLMACNEGHSLRRARLGRLQRAIDHRTMDHCD